MKNRKSKPRIDYRKIRMDLLRACLTSFLELLTQPSSAKLKCWQRLTMSYHDLTELRPIDAWCYISMKDFRERSLTPDKMSKEWLELLLSVKKADEKLGQGSDFYSRYLAISPFKGTIVLWAKPRLGPNGYAKKLDELMQLRTQHGVANDALPVFAFDGTYLFAAFSQAAA